MEFAELQTFIHAATLGGLTRAGERMGISKSIVSRRLAKLEAELGGRLLTRTTRGISLTEAGVDFLVHAERILTEADDARTVVAGRNGELAGQLRLAAPQSFGVEHLAPALGEFAAVATPGFAAPAANWTIDRPTSKIGFVAAMNGQAINGTFRRFDARIAFDPANLAGSSVITTIDPASAATGDQTRDEALPSDDWFNAKLFPRATFKSTGFKSLGGNRYIATGTLAIRDKMRPISLPFQLVTNGTKAQMRGSLTIDRRWFGVGQGQFAGTDAVAANVRIDIVIDAHRS